MSIEKHPVFIAPKKNQKIWRYMDFAKYVSLLNTSELYFASQISLCAIDPLEGSVSKANIESRKILAELIIKDTQKNAPDLSELSIATLREAVTRKNDFLENQRYHAYINCWHMNDWESAAMWSQYNFSNEGIAITSTYSKIKSCLDLSDERIFLGKVVYLDYEKEVVPEGNMLNGTIHKRKSYEHEKELRAVIVDLKDVLNPSANSAKGKKIKVDLNNLIETVYISPTSPIWMHSLVESISRKFLLHCEVKQSNIFSSPIF